MRLFGDGKITKNELVKGLLLQDYHFNTHSSELWYKVLRIENDYIYARLSKKSQRTRVLSPETNYAEEIDDHWPYVEIFINASSDPDVGQTIALEHKKSLFPVPSYPLSWFASEVNMKLKDENYVVHINPIIVEGKFWETVRENKGNIKEVHFTFNPPNLFLGTSKLEKELGAAAEQFNFDTAEIAFKNEDEKLVLDENNNFLDQAQKYVSRGAGAYRLNAKKMTYSSKTDTKTKRIELEDFNLQSATKEDFIAAISKIFS